MWFTITVMYERKPLKLLVERIYQDKAHEQYKVSSKARFLILQTNRPVLKARGLKHKPQIWEVLEGQLRYKSLTNDIIKAVQKGIELNEP